MTIIVPFFKSQAQIQYDLDKPFINFGYDDFTDFINHLRFLQRDKILISYHIDSTHETDVILKFYFTRKILNKVYKYFGYASFDHFHKTLKGLKAQVSYDNFSLTLKLVSEIL